MTKEKEDKVKTLYFKLADKRAVWRTPDGTISLSVFAGGNEKAPIGGTVSSTDRMNYARVLQAIDHGVLIMVSKKETAPKKMPMREVTGVKERQAQIQMAAKAFVEMRIEQALMQMKDVGDPRVLTKIIEFESKGRRRKQLIDAAQEKLSTSKASSLTEFVEEGKDIEAEFSPEQNTGKTGKTLEQAFDQ